LEKYYTSALALHNSAVAATDTETSFTLYLRVIIVYTNLIKVKTPLREAAAAAKVKCLAVAGDAMDKVEVLKKQIRAAIQEELQAKRDAMVSGCNINGGVCIRPPPPRLFLCVLTVMALFPSLSLSLPHPHPLTPANHGVQANEGIPELPTVPSFGGSMLEVPTGQPVMASPELMRRMAALSGGDFSAAHGAFGKSASTSTNGAPVGRTNSLHFTPFSNSGVPSIVPIERADSGNVPNIAPLVGPPGAVQPVRSIEVPVVAPATPTLLDFGSGADGSNNNNGGVNVTAAAAGPPDALSAALAGLDFNPVVLTEPTGPFIPVNSDALYTLLSVEDTASSTLLLDTRERNEYQTSHMVSSGHSIAVLNIPESWLIKGVDPSTIETKLRKSGSKRMFNNRDAYQTVAIIPGTNTDPNDPDGPLMHLLDALVTFAAAARLQNKPQVLVDGYHDFFFAYQIFCSGEPLVKPASEPNYADMVPRISEQQYPTLDNVMDFLNPKPVPVHPPQPTTTSSNASNTSNSNATENTAAADAFGSYIQTTTWHNTPTVTGGNSAVAPTTTTQQPLPSTTNNGRPMRQPPQPKVISALNVLGGLDFRAAQAINRAELDAQAVLAATRRAAEQAAAEEVRGNAARAAERMAAEAAGREVRARAEREAQQQAAEDAAARQTRARAAAEAERDAAAREAAARASQDAADRQAAQAAAEHAARLRAAQIAADKRAAEREAHVRAVRLEAERQEAIQARERDARAREAAAIVAAARAARERSVQEAAQTAQRAAQAAAMQRKAAADEQAVRAFREKELANAAESARRTAAAAAAATAAANQPRVPPRPGQGHATFPSSRPTPPAAGSTQQRPPHPPAAAAHVQPHRPQNRTSALPPAPPSGGQRPAAAKPQAPTSIRLSARYRAARLTSMAPQHGFERKSNKALTGLRNLGNTCFMNSVVQCLVNTVPLSMFFVQGQYRYAINRYNKDGTAGELSEEYGELVSALWLRGYKSLSPGYFKQSIAKFAPQFAGTSQHDCQEFCSYLLDGLHEDLNLVTKKEYIEHPDLDHFNDVEAGRKMWELHIRRNNSIVMNLFHGQLKSTLKCRTCNYESKSFDPFTFLSLSVPPRSTTTLDTLLRQFTEAELVSGADSWMCTKCKAPREAVKTISAWKLPRVLIVHLKRFYYEGPFRSKLNTKVNFPLNGLTIPDPSRPGHTRQYSLYGTANHVGDINGGHYTAYCKNPESGRWNEFNDSTVTPMSESKVCSNQAYMLFYTAMDFNADLFD
jgi:ubiquitin carboxyl-terminal hydrolase 8